MSLVAILFFLIAGATGVATAAIFSYNCSRKCYCNEYLKQVQLYVHAS